MGSSGSGRPPARGGSGAGPGSAGMGSGIGMGGTNRPGTFGGTGDPSGGVSEADEDDPNLVEFAIYGIASLYERFPARKIDPNAPVDAAKK